MSLHSELLERKDEILEIAVRHGARTVRIFGSVARGEETPASDLDLLVEFEPGRSLLDHIALVQDLGGLLGRLKEKRLDISWRRICLEQGILAYWIQE